MMLPDLKTRLRLPDWEYRLAEFLLELYRATKRGECGFSWDPSKKSEGMWNCITFSSACVERTMGVDLYAMLAGDEAYTNPQEAFKTLLKRGAKNLDELLLQFFVPKGVSYTHHGDLVLVPGTTGLDAEQAERYRGLDLAVAIAEPPHFWTISSAGGLARGSMADVVKAYSVGWGD